MTRARALPGLRDRYADFRPGLMQINVDGWASSSLAMFTVCLAGLLADVEQGT
jgi:hypothetical protein